MAEKRYAIQCDLSSAQALALGKFLSRVGWSDVLNCGMHAEEVPDMFAAADRVLAALQWQDLKVR